MIITRKEQKKTIKDFLELFGGLSSRLNLLRVNLSFFLLFETLLLGILHSWPFSFDLDHLVNVCDLHRVRLYILVKCSFSWVHEAYVLLLIMTTILVFNVLNGLVVINFVRLLQNNIGGTLMLEDVFLVQVFIYKTRIKNYIFYLPVDSN